MKEIVILIGIIALGLLLLRLAIGAITLLLVGKAGTLTVSNQTVRIFNLVESIIVIYTYIVLVSHYYAS